MIAAMLSAVITPILAQAAPAVLPQCQGQFSISFDGENGSFNGMSHSGVLLVLRNLGPGACRTPGLAVLLMKDAAGRTLPFARETPPGMHPGPVVSPVGVAAGAEATAALYWVSAPVYETSRCATPARLVVKTGPDAVTLPWPAGQVCGPAGKPIPYREAVLRTDPTLAPQADGVAR